ncbi:hypothetical protein BDZ94DRAFT_699410 [Collybia nuda]|uniref:Uncharacterized protein n=1 Tax=Collybia nuda TaxID=64659 RepID=A0A9P5Y543_9AGAR|nr:hypothetical protein BDZ94DRAFT_699410 [Collybia nuda]
MPTLSRRSSRSTNTTTTLRSPKPPGWSGSTKSTPVKAKNGASAALSYVFAEPEMANLGGDGLGAATTLSSSASAGRTMSLDQGTPDGQNSEQHSIPKSPTPARKAMWYGSLTRSRGKKHTQQLGRVDEPQPDRQPRPNIVVQQFETPSSAEVVLSESPTTMHEVRASPVEQHLPEPPIPTSVVQDVEIAPPVAPSPVKRRWFSSATPAVQSTPVGVAEAYDIPKSTSPPQPAAIDVPEIALDPNPAPSSPSVSIQTPPVSSVSSAPDPLVSPPNSRGADTTTVPTPPERVPVTPKHGWFSSSATPAAVPHPPSEVTPTIETTPTAPLLSPPGTPILVLPAPPDVASVMEKVEAASSPLSEQAQPTQPLPPPPVKRSWFSSYTPASTSTASLPAPAPAPTTPPRSPHSHSIPSSLDDEVPVLSSLPFPSSASGSGPGLSMNSITPSPSVSGLPAPSSPIPSPAPSNSSSTSSGSTVQPEPRQRLSSLSSLNPSTSRFTLSIPLPLLGRAKVSLPVSKKEEMKDVEQAGVSQAAKNIPQIIGEFHSSPHAIVVIDVYHV